jgi:hypothetical protein
VLDTLREVVEALAPLERRAGSVDERRAAEWLAQRLAAAGARDARVEDVPFRDGYAAMLLPLNVAALTGKRALALAAALLVADDVSNYKRLWRRAVTRPKTTTNVIAEAGDPDSDHTLVVLAHHDAAPTGLVFDQSFQRWLAARFPELVARTDTSLPLWWSVVAGPLLIALGARRTGRIVAVLSGLFGLDIARSRVVPGANDNLSGCAALVALAEQDELPVRVILASCGAEEVLQGGIYAFVDDHLRKLDPARTWVLNLDTIGSPELFMLEGEGPFVMEDYSQPGFRDRVAAAAERTGAPLRRGCRARTSTDSVIPSRAGYATACLCSWEPDTKLLSNYHLPTDVPENLRYETIERAVRITAALADDLGRQV